MKRLFSYEDPIYRRTVFVMIAATPRRMQRLAKLIFKEDIEEPEGLTAGTAKFEHPIFGQTYVVAFMENDPAVSTVAHEAAHVTENTLWNAGMEHNRETREAWAYLLGFHVRSITRIFNDPRASVRSKATD